MNRKSTIPTSRPDKSCCRAITKYSVAVCLYALLLACAENDTKARQTVARSEPADRFHCSTSDRFHMNGRSYLMDRSPLSIFPGYADIFRPEGFIESLSVPTFEIEEETLDKFYIVQWRLRHDSLYLQSVDFDWRVVLTTKNASELYSLIEKLTGRKFDENVRIFADWVNGRYRVKLPDTPTTYRETLPQNTDSIRRPMCRYLELTFRNGRLVSRKTIEPEARRTRNAIEADSRIVPQKPSVMKNRIKYEPDGPAEYRTSWEYPGPSFERIFRL